MAKTFIFLGLEFGWNFWFKTFTAVTHLLTYECTDQKWTPSDVEGKSQCLPMSGQVFRTTRKKRWVLVPLLPISFMDQVEKSRVPSFLQPTSLLQTWFQVVFYWSIFGSKWKAWVLVPLLPFSFLEQVEKKSSSRFSTTNLFISDLVPGCLLLASFWTTMKKVGF